MVNVEAAEVKVVVVKGAAKAEAVDKTEEVVVVRLVRGKEQARRARTRVRFTPGTRPPDTRTCRRSRPAPGTGFLGRLHISVKSQVLAHGRIFGCLKVIATNEIQADSRKCVKRLTNRFIICYMLTSKKTK